jgi:hypothetical protein
MSQAMSDYDDTDDNTDETDDTEYFPPAPDPFAAVLTLCRLAANPKAGEAMLRRIRKAERAATAAEQRCATAEAKLEQRQAALDARASELDELTRAIAGRETAFEASLEQARDDLREFYDDLADTDRRIRFRIAHSNGLLDGFNERLQSLPTWEQIRQLVPGLPDDPPPPSAAEIVSRNVREDWTGHSFLAESSLTRSVNKAVDQ